MLVLVTLAARGNAREIIAANVMLSHLIVLILRDSGTSLRWRGTAV